MTRLFRWSMRHGAAILFAIALLQLVAGLLVPIGAFLSETSRMATHHSYSGDGNVSLLPLLGQLLYSLASFGLYLAAALIVDRADRWLALRGVGEGAQ